MENENRYLKEIKELVLMEGHAEGSELFEKRFKQLQITKCREMKGVFSCGECKFYDYCELVKSMMREIKGY